ncbi:Putative purine permease [Fulvia fulva]|uniref:Purine permease n=1 Tax=Passalora fulva TaxID=5499 RepID=A0A9Q8P3P4_PASFU|nr:Putative purine permease [Fulvia fulva]KAK4634064.1 putative purine permease [Fulvia fulva]KAK4636983.1 putative purine permease [Fulvia fulva]UJO12240.1 Putative purine permease [Fulvia fulva]WPV08988.1 Putative purine permease [Fulvia fulva]WPV25060.1 Putative purine permease [Fulvia fulva]
MDNKEGTVARSAPASSDEYIPPEEAKTGTWRLVWEEFKHTCTTRDGLIGDYDYAYLFTPNIWPFNKKYKDHVPPFWYPDGKIPLLLILILGIQHALTMISGIVTPVLAISRGAFYLDTKTVEYLVSAAFITSGIGTLIQITRTRIRGTPFYIGAGILSVIGPTFDIIPITMKYTAPLYARGICPTSESGTKLPCPDAYGKLIGTILVCVWMQFLVSFIPLKKIFPPMVTGNLLLVLGIYLVTTAGESWGGGASCLDGAGIYRLCPNVNAPKPLLWGDPKFIGIGFSVFVTIILIEIVGSPLMKSASIIFGLAVGSAITGALGYWSISTINQAPAVTFLWTSTFKLGVDGTLVLPLMILFICEAMVCMPSIAATSEASGVDTEGIKANTRIQGGILCDATGSLIAALGFTIPMVSHAGNNGVIVVTSNASRRAGYCASVIIILMGVFGKFGGVFAAMPSVVLGGMQTFLYATIAISGMRILASIPWTRRNRFILSASFGLGLLDIVTPEWFSQVLAYSGPNVQLMGFLEGVNLIVETPFILTMLVAVLLNLIMPRDKRDSLPIAAPLSGESISSSEGAAPKREE